MTGGCGDDVGSGVAFGALGGLVGGMQTPANEMTAHNADSAAPTTVIEWGPVGYWMAPGGRGSNQGYRCGVCGCMVDMLGLKTHEEWHIPPVDWHQLALHALHDLCLVGVDIALIRGVTPDVVAEVNHYSRSMESFS